MTLTFGTSSEVPEVVEVHVYAEYYHAKCSVSRTQRPRTTLNCTLAQYVFFGAHTQTYITTHQRQKFSRLVFPDEFHELQLARVSFQVITSVFCLSYRMRWCACVQTGGCQGRQSVSCLPLQFESVGRYLHRQQARLHRGRWRCSTGGLTRTKSLPQATGRRPLKASHQRELIMTSRVYEPVFFRLSFGVESSE